MCLSHLGAEAVQGALHGTSHGKPTPAKMMEDLVEQLSALMASQQQRAEEAAELRKMVGAVIERLDQIEAKK